MLLFKHLYNKNILLFNKIMQNLFENSEVSFGGNFENQVKNNVSNSVPDASITQNSLSIIIETKLDANKFNQKQLKEHCKRDDNHKDTVYLLCIAPQPNWQSNIILDTNKNNIQYASFKKIIKTIEENIDEYDRDLQDILADYKEYCLSESLIKPEYIFIPPINNTYIDINTQHKIYCEPYSRNARLSANYIGYYNNKNIKYISKIDYRVIIIDNKYINEQDKKEITDTLLIERLDKFRDELGWKNLEDFRYFVSNKQIEVNFEKESKGGIMGARYYKLPEDKIDDNTTLQDVANILIDIKIWD